MASKKSIIEAHKKVDSLIREYDIKVKSLSKERENFIKVHGYPFFGDKTFDKIVKQLREAEEMLARFKKSKEYLLPIK